MHENIQGQFSSGNPEITLWSRHITMKAFYMNIVEPHNRLYSPVCSYVMLSYVCSYVMFLDAKRTVCSWLARSERVMK